MEFLEPQYHVRISTKEKQTKNINHWLFRSLVQPVILMYYAITVLKWVIYIKNYFKQPIVKLTVEIFIPAIWDVGA